MDDQFEQLGIIRRATKRALIDPLANYLPARWLRGALKFARSELAAANWADPGGWRSMVISYDGNPRQIADRILVKSGKMAMALRNRLRLTTRLLRELIESGASPAHVLCLGAGPGQAILPAMAAASAACDATLVDLNPDAFGFGRELAERHGLIDRVKFVEGDVRYDLGKMLTGRPTVVKMIGLCEYLTDEEIVEIAGAVAGVMSDGGAIISNDLSRRHGNERFFRRVFGLHMRHRSAAELAELFEQAGFGGFSLYPEPLGVYNVLVGRRRVG